jgi:ribonuclease BN (tRNA processing enzyme)
MVRSSVGMKSPGVTRRAFLAKSGLGGALLCLRPPWAYAQDAAIGADRLVLLGTKGGPTIRGYTPSPCSNLLVYKNVPYVIDAGYGTSFKLVQSGLPLCALRTVFITHHHSDHNLDLGPMIYNAWVTGLNEQVDVFGPAGTRDLVEAYWRSNQFDIETRIADSGRSDLRKLVLTHEYAEGVVFASADLKVTALRNLHPPVVESFALRFELGDGRKIVFSGDTTYFPPLAEFARGADYLIHEIMYGPAIERLADRNPNARTMLAHLKASHTLAEDVGRIATAANVKKLVLSHFVPADDNTITEQMWREAVAKTYSGPLVVGRDLLELPL